MIFEFGVGARHSAAQSSPTLTLHFYFKTKRTQDLDNYNKLVLDALTGIIYVDDGQISALHLYRCYDKDRPRIEVTVH